MQRHVRSGRCSQQLQFESVAIIRAVRRNEACDNSSLVMLRRTEPSQLRAQQDRVEVLRRAQVFSAVGVEYFADVMSLRSGELWESEIYRRIDDADVFMLFWSEAARQSAWVEREWRYALTVKGLEFIYPVVLELPMPPPPMELASLHFRTSLAYLNS
jgi:hypothetical protein